MNDRTGFVIGDGSVYRTDNGGKTWTCLTQRVPESDIFSPRDGFFLDPYRGWLVDHARILSTVDGGQTWDDISPYHRSTNQPDCQDEHFAVRFLTPDVGWVVGKGARESSCQDTSYVLRTSDGGHTWGRITLDAGTKGDFLFDLDFKDARRGWAVGYYGIYSTVDGGVTWQIQSCVPDGDRHPHAWPMIQFVDPDHGVVVANGQVKFTRDGGLNWFEDQQLKDICYVRSSFFVTNTIGFVSGDDFLLRTTDGGATWQTVGTGGVVFRISFSGRTTGWAMRSCLTDSFAITKTEDGGASWVTIFTKPTIRRRLLRH